MRVGITGSKESNTSGHVMNGWMHDYFKDHEIIQLSRSTGYDFNINYAEAVEVAKTVDIFVNSAAVGDCQVRFLNDLYGHVPKIITLGSVAGDFSEALPDFYPKMKHEVKLANKLLPLRHGNSFTKLLHLTITEVENLEKGIAGLTYEQLAKMLDFWLENPIFINIDLKYFNDVGYQTDTKNEKVKRIVDYYENN